MAEFAKTIHTFDRYCEAHAANGCQGCKIRSADTPNKALCSQYIFKYPVAAEKILSEWDMQNPEPIIPTWIQWLSLKMNLKELIDESGNIPVGGFLNKLNEQIPDYILKAHNIDPLVIPVDAEHEDTDENVQTDDQQIEQEREKSGQICTMCGKKLDEWDLQENFGFDYNVGYGSKYDCQHVKAQFCCSCFDKLLDHITSQSKTSPIVSELSLDDEMEVLPDDVEEILEGNQIDRSDTYSKAQ